MNISRQHDDADTVRVALAGELDLASSGGVREHLDEVIHRIRPRHLLIDMAEVTFCDSTGIEALICTRAAAAEQGIDFRLVKVQGIALMTLQITGVLPLLVKEPDAG